MLDIRKRMKKRFRLIHNWLKEAEKDYEENKKTEGELNLLLAQAEVRRAWELSCQEELAPKAVKKGLLSYSKLAAALCLSAFLLAGLAFHFPLGTKTAVPPEVGPQPQQEHNLLISEEENKFFSPSSTSEPVEKPVEEKETKVTEQEKVQVHHAEELSSKKQSPSKEQTIHQEVSQPIKVDVVDLVEEAQKALYQSNGGQIQH